MYQTRDQHVVAGLQVSDQQTHEAGSHFNVTGVNTNPRVYQVGNHFMASLQASANGPTITGQEDIQDPDSYMTSNALPIQMENGNTGGFHLYDNIPPDI